MLRSGGPGEALTLSSQCKKTSMVEGRHGILKGEAEKAIQLSRKSEGRVVFGSLLDYKLDVVWSALQRMYPFTKEAFEDSLNAKKRQKKKII